MLMFEHKPILKITLSANKSIVFWVSSDQLFMVFVFKSKGDVPLGQFSDNWIQTPSEETIHFW